MKLYCLITSYAHTVSCLLTLLSFIPHHQTKYDYTDQAEHDNVVKTEGGINGEVAAHDPVPTGNSNVVVKTEESEGENNSNSKIPPSSSSSSSSATAAKTSGVTIDIAAADKISNNTATTANSGTQKRKGKHSYPATRHGDVDSGLKLWKKQCTLSILDKDAQEVSTSVLPAFQSTLSTVLFTLLLMLFISCISFIFCYAMTLHSIATETFTGTSTSQRKNKV